MRPTKEQRWDAIKIIVSSRKVTSQEELQAALEGEGLQMTQATLSRDIKEMKIAKVADTDGKYFYSLPGGPTYRHAAYHSPSQLLMKSGFVSLHYSGNLAVMHTRPGYASSMAYDIDRHECPHILGTVAGDDTILMVLNEKATRQEVSAFLAQIIPNLQTASGTEANEEVV